jgi:hypothetical protein
MTLSLTQNQAKWGLAVETTTVGNGDLSEVGIPNLNRAEITSGQTYIEDRKMTGAPVLSASEIIDDMLDPRWAPETTMFHPQFGAFVKMLTQSSSESGSGPYVQAIEPNLLIGHEVTHGAATAGTSVSCAAWQLVGQSTSRDVQGKGGIVERIDVVIPETGRVTVTPTIRFFDYDNAVNGTPGTTEDYRLPAKSIEKMARDFVYKIGDSTPSALYSKEMRFSLIADLVPHRYGGVGASSAPGALPFRYVYNGFRLEGSFSKPLLATTDTLSKDFFIQSGETGLDQLLYVYSRTMTDYNEAAASLSDGEMRFTFNIKIDDVTLGFDDETIENVTFKGVYDDTNNIFKVEQCTAASQAWA